MKAAAIETDIRKQVKKGINHADDTTVKLILAMLQVQEHAVEEETAYEKEMIKRIEDYEQGRVETYSFDELATNAGNAFAALQKNAE